MTPRSLDSFGARTTLDTPSGALAYFRLATLEEQGLTRLDRLPVSIRVLLEALLRGEDGERITRRDVLALAAYDPERPGRSELPFPPARVLLQDFTGVPAVVDLAALRSAMARLGGDPEDIDPVIPVDLVVDHSVQVDAFGSHAALGVNTARELERNRERYTFLRWGQDAFESLRVVPPGAGICHQVNLEYLAPVVQQRDGVAFFDSLVGTDSHTTMINGLGVLGWGVGGIEAESGMLGEPLAMLPPPVVGVKLTGRLPTGATATDLVLLITERLRAVGVVGSFVEYFGPGVAALSVPDRATIANMSPEMGCTMGFFPVDDRTIEFLRATGRPEEQVLLVEAYHRAQGTFRTADSPAPSFARIVELDLGDVVPSLAGPKRPQDRIALSELHSAFRTSLTAPAGLHGFGLAQAELSRRGIVELDDGPETIGHGAVVIAAITSCTNTSNPSVMLAAGLLAKKAAARGLVSKPWVKTSLAPGSTVVTGYLERAGLLPGLEALGFHVVGYGCTTCIGNSGPLPPPVAAAVRDQGLVAAGVVSGNRNFEGRINPLVKASYLASPPLVVAYAIAGTVDLDVENAPLGHDAEGRPVFLREIWPSEAEVAEALVHASDPELFRSRYEGVELGSEGWNALEVPAGAVYDWDPASTYIQQPPFFEGMEQGTRPIQPILGARVLLKLGDSVTTDHISPAGAIDPDHTAGRWLQEQGVQPWDFNSFGSRRGNDRVMTRGTFANIRLRNQLAPGTEGGWTTHLPTGEVCTVHEAAQRYRAEGTPLVVLAGRDYGMGSSRDWAAKGTKLLGVRAVIAESYERIHRSNLVGMGVLPLELLEGQSLRRLGLTGRERFDIPVSDGVEPGQELVLTVTDEGGASRELRVLCRIDTPAEVAWYREGGILNDGLRKRLGQP
jgi:aconitate hydratase